MIKKLKSETYSIKLAAHKVPLFLEQTRREDPYVTYGADTDNDRQWFNLYPNYLLQLFNRCSKHNAIVLGKASFILGQGFKKEDTLESARLFNWLDNINPSYDSTELARRIITDLELFGGFILKIHTRADGKGISEIYHADFYKYRTNIASTKFYYTANWGGQGYLNPQLNDDFTEYPAYVQGSQEPVQIFYYRQYRPGLNCYPLPEYIGAAAAIETDIEIWNYHLNNTKNGFWGGKLISYPNAPQEEDQADVERKLQRKFAGTDNANKFILSFGAGDQQIQISDLTNTNSDKIFESLIPNITQEIITGHKITSGMLFGIKEPGSLGGRSEILDAWNIFQSSYVAPKQKEIERVFNFFAEVMGVPAQCSITPLKPAVSYSEATVVAAMTPEELRRDIGLDPLPTTALPNGSPAISSAPDSLPTEDLIPTQNMSINDNIKNLTAKQHQQLIRIIRQYNKQQLTQQAATALLKAGLGLSDSEILSLLGIEEDEVELSKFSEEIDEKLLTQFKKYGINKKDIFETHRKLKDGDAMLFAQGILSKDELKVISLLDNDPLTKTNTIAELLKLDVAEVDEIINTLVEEKYIKIKDLKSLIGEPTKYTVLKKGSDIIADVPKSVSIKSVYEYQERIGLPALLTVHRPFCAKIISLGRVYTRADIQTISQKVGYDVFEYTGGFYTNPKTLETTPYCRHEWKSRIIYTTK